MQAVERASWQNPKVLTTLILVFVAGAFTGALSMQRLLHDRLHFASASSWKDPHTARMFLDRCESELKLTPKQRTEMASILDDYKSYYQGLQDQLDDVRATGKSKIMQLLDDEQKKKFDKMLTEAPKP